MKHGLEDSIAIAHIHEHKVGNAGYVLQAHGDKFLLQVGAALVSQFARVAHVLLVEKSGKSAGLSDPIGIERLARSLKHGGQLGSGDPVADTEIRKAP